MTIEIVAPAQPFLKHGIGRWNPLQEQGVRLAQRSAMLREIVKDQVMDDREHETQIEAVEQRKMLAAGWRNREHLSLLDRLTGESDLVLMLAVIHHLILRDQLPLAHIADLCASLTRRWLLLEWVPPSDPMFQEWLRGRDDLYGHLTENDLTQAFAPFFTVVDRTRLDNGRILLLFDKMSKVDN